MTGQHILVSKSEASHTTRSSSGETTQTWQAFQGLKQFLGDCGAVLDQGGQQGETQVFFWRSEFCCAAVVCDGKRVLMLGAFA